MAITGNAVASFVPSLQALTQRLREEANAAREFEQADEAVIGGVVKVLDEVDSLLIELSGVHDKIAADVTLSAVGQQQKLTAIVEQYFSKLKFVHNAATLRREAFDSAQREAYAIPKSPGDPTANALLEMETRNIFRGLSIQERMQRYQRAVETRNLVMLNAIKHPAFADEFVSDPALKAFIDRTDREQIEFKQPVTWSRMETLKRAADWLMLLWNALTLSMEGYGQGPAFAPKVKEPEKQMKLGTPNQQADPA